MSKKSTVAPKEEAAFRRSGDGYFFKGKRLEPFSFVRKTALMEILAIIGQNPLSELSAALWLMTQPDSVCHQARRAPSTVENKIARWADENRILGRNLTSANECYKAVCEDDQTSKFTPKLPEKGAVTDEGDDPN